MANYARIENNKAVEFTDVDPVGRFHPSLVWMECDDLADQTWTVHNGVLVAPVNLALICDKIDEAAGKARARYLTIAPGQEATYLYKSMQAAAFKTASCLGTVPTFIQAEADAIGCTPQEAADTILAQEAMWMVKGAQIEGVRRSWKLALESSTDVLTELEAALAEINSL